MNRTYDKTPDIWLLELHQAALAMDEQDIFKLIQQIPDTEAVLSEKLTNLVDNLRLDVIVNSTELFNE